MCLQRRSPPKGSISYSFNQPPLRRSVGCCETCTWSILLHGRPEDDNLAECKLPVCTRRGQIECATAFTATVTICSLVESVTPPAWGRHSSIRRRKVPFFGKHFRPNPNTVSALPARNWPATNVQCRQSRSAGSVDWKTRTDKSQRVRKSSRGNRWRATADRENIKVLSTSSLPARLNADKDSDVSVLKRISQCGYDNFVVFLTQCTVANTKHEPLLWIKRSQFHERDPKNGCVQT